MSEDGVAADAPPAAPPAPDASAAPLSAEEKAQRMKAFRWFHALHLGDGVMTPGVKRAQRLAFEADRVFRYSVAGMSVLDVGCWDGFFAFEARRRGASRAVGADHYVWGGPGWGDKGAFDLARACIDPEVEAIEIDIADMTPQTVGTFDVVLFLGVFNHMKNPFGTIERVAALAEQMLVIDTPIEEKLPHAPPSMAFYPTNELNNDPSSWWAPNRALVSAMLGACGFSKIDEDVVFATRSTARGLFHAIR